MRFTSEKITNRLLRICDGSDVCEYLLLGDKKAALIDTGYGIGDLKGYIESLTSLPYNVFVTHGHVDHASGAGQFDTVYMNLKDVDLFQRHCTVAFRKRMLESHTALRIEDNEYIPQREEPFLDLQDGMVENLGGVSLTFVWVPGHTQGMMVPICKEERIAFFGDACGVGVLLLMEESSTVKEYLESLKKLQQFEPCYDTVLRQHGTCRSTTHVLEDNIENCQLILEGKDAHIESELLGQTCYWAQPMDKHGDRIDGREGNICYSMQHIGG